MQEHCIKNIVLNNNSTLIWHKINVGKSELYYCLIVSVHWFILSLFRYYLIYSSQQIRQVLVFLLCTHEDPDTEFKKVFSTLTSSFLPENERWYSCERCLPCTRRKGTVISPEIGSQGWEKSIETDFVKITLIILFCHSLFSCPVVSNSLQSHGL